jgi:hypothetical protein
MGFYDAFILYASIVRRLYDNGDNYTDGLAVAQAMWNTSVRTPLQTDVVINSIGDRVVLFDIRSFDMERASHAVCSFISQINMQFWLKIDFSLKL